MKKVSTILLVLIVQTTNFAQNRNTVDSLKNIIAETTQDTVKIQAYLDLAYEYKDSNPDTALVFANYALKKSLIIKYKKGIAEAYRQKGEIAIFSKNYKYADSLLNIAISIHQKNNYQYGIMKCYISLSGNAYHKAEFRLILKYCNKALKIAENNNFFEDKAKIMNHMGIAYEQMGSYDKAIEYTLDALKIHEKLGNKKGIANCNANIGDYFRIINEFDKAIKYINKAMNLFIELKHIRGQSVCLSNIGIVYSYRNKHDEALQCFNKAVELNKNINDLIGLSIDYSNIGNVYSNLEKYNKAVEYYNKSLKIKGQIGYKLGTANCYFGIALVKIKQKEYNLAEENCLKSLELFEENKQLDYQQKVLKHLTKIYNLTGKYKKAFNTQNKAIVIKDSLFNIEKAQKIAQLEEKYLNEKYEKEILELNCETDSQQTEILQQKKLRNIYLIAFVFALAAIILIVIQFHKKNIANKFLVNKNMDLLSKEQELKKIKEELQSKFQNNNPQYIISETEKEKILNKMTKLLDTDKIFKTFDLTCSKFAKRLSTNRNYFSQIISDEYGKKYNDFINEYRVKEAMLMLSDSQKSGKFSVEAIGNEAGFKTSSSFYLAFKKYTGVTPSLFRNNIKGAENK